MRHRKAGLKLNRTPSHRDAMFRNLVTSLFKYERIQTTRAKAKELRRWADHLITLAKRGDLHARRQALAIVREKAVVHKLFEQAAQRFGAISGGYTRIVKLGIRPGDAAPISLVELAAAPEKAKKKAKKKKTKADVKTKPAAPAEKSGADKQKSKEEAAAAKVKKPSAKADEPVTETASAAKEKAADAKKEVELDLKKKKTVKTKPAAAKEKAKAAKEKKPASKTKAKDEA